MKKIMIASSVSLSILLVLFMATNPANVPSFVLVLPFILLFVLLVCGIVLALKKRGMDPARSWRIGALIAAVPMTLLVLQSIGQLTVRDLLTIGALFLLSYFYIARTTARA
jgi:Mn2+/Fe2+ NRAMP family transporter